MSASCPSCGTQREDISKKSNVRAWWCGECGVIQYVGIGDPVWGGQEPRSSTPDSAPSPVSE